MKKLALLLFSLLFVIGTFTMCKDNDKTDPTTDSENTNPPSTGTAIISGIVTDENGNPMNGVSVS